jgi:EAL domain-containing protein (putative c-di-GMP-specific phosphodiesterase class I)
MVSILVKIMRDMAIEVIAEGIENETQLKLCRELGVNYGQGWYWGRAKAI